MKKIFCSDRLEGEIQNDWGIMLGIDSMEKLIITTAITGSRITREATPYIPLRPEEIVASAIECWEAGASISISM